MMRGLVYSLLGLTVAGSALAQTPPGAPVAGGIGIALLIGAVAAGGYVALRKK